MIIRPTLLVGLLSACALPIARSETKTLAVSRQLHTSYTPNRIASRKPTLEKDRRFAVLADSGWNSLHDFAANGSEGKYPTGSMIDGGNGIVYGTTNNGGNGNGGTFYKAVITGTKSSPSTTISVLHHFSDGSVSNDGKHCRGKLAKDATYIYGTCMYGGGTSGHGGLGDGVVYRINVSTGAVTILHRFKDGSVSNDGSVPHSLVISTTTVASDPAGTIYGVTMEGGSGGNGTIYKLVPSGGGYSYSIVYHFSSSTWDGVGPSSILLESGDARLVGVAVAGGANNTGTVWHYRFNYSSFGLLVDVPPGLTISPESSGLIEFVPDGFWGVASWDSVNSGGLIYRVSPNVFGYMFTTMHQFQCSSTTGCMPNSDLVFSRDLQGGGLSDYYIYGSTLSGGTSSQGSVFQMDSHGNFRDFAPFVGPLNQPWGGFIEASINGAPVLIGSSYWGGANYVGLLWEVWLN